ncbi:MULTISPECIES: hypothetical protein [Bacillus]|uniref:Uncharacterized protein n=2 Tax=Bacillus TaxID=1386 RepID=A0A0M4FXP6_9BACI|nr:MULTISPECIES: hypothetical protein [Bacillus]ALC83780.1 hypothetical protein AM592_21360 [Bacillus gobiensis]MBP1084005.1 hypothetical protein [Bacillus capparidis]MED1096947.1 hypothetical protein [Bacillus capparidis]
MGIFQINEEGEIRGAINPSILAKTFIYEKKSFVFKDSKKNVIKFLNLCLQEIKTFYNKFYKLLEERTSLFEGIDTIKGQ